MGLKYEDYKHLAQPEETVDNEIRDASQQQEDRQESTPNVDWEKRYKDLEVAYSRQGQQIGEYRTLVDNYLTSTPEEVEETVATPITSDDIYDDPQAAVQRAVDQHPAVKKVADLEAELEKTRREAIMDAFRAKHPDFTEAVASPEFANWVNEDPTRIELTRRADGFDMIAADALMTLWEQSQAASSQASAAEVEQVVLESGSGAEPPAPDRYSRSEMLRIMTRAKQGDLEAQEYMKMHAAAYREALTSGSVRD